MDFATAPDSLVETLMDFLVRRYPSGNVAFGDLQIEERQTEGAVMVRVEIVPSADGVTQDGALRGGRAELYMYDEKRGTWSVQ